MSKVETIAARFSRHPPFGDGEKKVATERIAVISQTTSSTYVRTQCQVFVQLLSSAEGILCTVARIFLRRPFW